MLTAMEGSSVEQEHDGLLLGHDRIGAFTPQLAAGFGDSYGT